MCHCPATETLVLFVAHKERKFLISSIFNKTLLYRFINVSSRIQVRQCTDLNPPKVAAWLWCHPPADVTRSQVKKYVNMGFGVQEGSSAWTAASNQMSTFVKALAESQSRKKTWEIFGLITGSLVHKAKSCVSLAWHGKRFGNLQERDRAWNELMMLELALLCWNCSTVDLLKHWTIRGHHT